MTSSCTAEVEASMADYLATASPDLVCELLSIFIRALMGADADAACRAGYGQRGPRKANSRNGYRRRVFQTQAGPIELAIPKLRYGHYYPGWLLRGRAHAARELINAATTCYLLGVSEQRITKLVESLGISSITKLKVAFLTAQLDQAVQAVRARPLNASPYRFVAADDLAVRAHRHGRVLEMQLLIATGVNAEGGREMLGAQLHSVDDGDRWLTFLGDLADRGLSGVELVTGSSEPELVSAINAILPAASWQRCIAHYASDLMAISPRSCRSQVHDLVNSIFAQRDAESVAAQYDRVLSILTGVLPRVAGDLRAARSELLVYTKLPDQLWPQIWSNNVCVLRPGALDNPEHRGGRRLAARGVHAADGRARRHPGHHEFA